MRSSIRLSSTVILISCAALALASCGGHAMHAADACTGTCDDGGVPDGAANPMPLPQWQWDQSLPIQFASPVISPFSATEIRSLVPFMGKLYAGISHWGEAMVDDPRSSGAEVLALDGPNDPWRVELELADVIPSGPLAGEKKYMSISAMNAVTVRTDREANAIAPVSILIAGVWTRIRVQGVEVHYRSDQDPTWQQDVIGADVLQPEPARAFTVYRDKITGVDRVFAGASVRAGAVPGGIASGAWDATQQRLVWDQVPESWIDAPDPSTTVAVIRVASFAETNGHLYAAAYDSIYERQDGPSPSWKRIFQHPWPSANVVGGTGFRGLVATTDPASGAPRLLVAQEGSPFLILNVDPAAIAPFQVEFNSAQFFDALWGVPTGYGCIAYNTMTRFPVSADPKDDLFLVGFEVAMPASPADSYAKWNHNARFLVRQPNGEYTVRIIEDPSISPVPVLLSTRTIVPSPFAGDPDGTLYAGGFDANQNNVMPVHNTGWIYRGHLR